MAKASTYPAMTALTGAEKLIGVQSTATEVVTLQEVADFVTAEAASSTFNYTATAAGAVARTARSKFGDVVSVKDFGAVGDGVVADTAAIDLAEDALPLGGELLFPGGPYSMANTRPPAGVTWVFNGAAVDRTQMGGSANFKAQRARYSYIDGPHPTYQVTAEYIRTLARGSEEIGQPYCDQALSISIEKEFWSETSGTPKAGEIDGLTISYRQGGPRVGGGDPQAGISSGAALLCNAGATEGSGATQILEAVNSVFSVPALALTRQIGVQLGMLNTRDSDYYGAVFYNVVGSQNAAIRVSGTTANPWNRIIENIKDSVFNFIIMDTGQIRWRNTATVTLDQEAATNDMLWKTEAGVEMARLDQSQALFQAKTKTNVKSGATYVLTIDDLCTLVSMTHSSAITMTLPNSLPAGFKCKVLQRDAAAQVTFSPEAGALLRNVDSHTKTKAMHAICDLLVTSNSAGNNAVWYLANNTAA